MKLYISVTLTDVENNFTTRNSNGHDRRPSYWRKSMRKEKWRKEAANKIMQFQNEVYEQLH
jgi:hypothetical protein